jgi:serine/threonine protein kinase
MSPEADTERIRQLGAIFTHITGKDLVSMNAELMTVDTTEVWAAWEDQVINGRFRLQRFLGGSDHSAVFLTECKAHGVAEAAIKLTSADTVNATEQLARWGIVAALTHAHVVRILEFGRCKLDGQELLYVVTEYAEQTLAQVLGRRALSPEEVRELFRPALEGLAFLHQKGLVHSRLTPSNLLAVNDQLKISADTVRAAGAPATDVTTGSVYEAPELRGGKMSLASDIWALGAIIVEALTQRTPVWADSLRESVRLPVNLPMSFAGIVKRCLATSPAQRPTAAELLAPFKSMPQIQVISTPLLPITPTQDTGSRGASPMLVPLLAIAGAFVVFLVVWAALRSPA